MGIFSRKIIIVSPCNGIFKNLQDVNDPVFSKGLAGVGFAISPADGKMYAPVDGIISMIFPTGHALGIKDKKGIEYLIHMGIDTVKLKGEGFKTVVKENQSVRKGDVISYVDLDLIKNYGLLTDVLVVVTNHKEICIKKNLAEVKVGDEIAYIENV